MLQAQSREPWVISAFLLMTHCSLRAGPRELQLRVAVLLHQTLSIGHPRRLSLRSMALKVAGWVGAVLPIYLPPTPVNNPRFLLDQGVPGSLAAHS